MAIVACARCGAKNRVDERADQFQPVCGRCGTKLDLDGAFSGLFPIHVTDANVGDILARAGDKPVLIDCWAPWCGPCRMVGPIVDQLAAESGGRYVVGKLNVDENQRTAGEYRISGIPTMLMFKNGRLVESLVGVRGKEELAGVVGRYV